MNEIMAQIHNYGQIMANYQIMAQTIPCSSPARNSS